MTGVRLPPAAAPGPVVLALATDDSFAHVYPSPAGLLTDTDIGTGPGERTGALEFFDVAGRRLAPVFTAGWRLDRLVPTGDEPQPERVLERLGRVVAHVRGFLERHPEEAARYGLTLDEAWGFLPELGGRSLEEDLALFVHDLPDRDLGLSALGDDDSGGFWHNLRHRVGWDHR